MNRRELLKFVGLAPLAVFLPKIKAAPELKHAQEYRAGGYNWLSVNYTISGGNHSGTTEVWGVTKDGRKEEIPCTVTGNSIILQGVFS